MAIPSTIRDMSTSAASNFPTGAEGIGTNLDDYLRAYQAIIRTESLNKTWQRQAETPTFVNGTTFTVPGNLTTTYVANRRVKASVTAGTVFGTIQSSTFGATTSVVVTWDSGALDSGLSEVQLGPETTGLALAGIAGAQTAIQANGFSMASDTGAANAYAVTLSPAPAAYTTGLRVCFFTANACTGSSTVNVNGLGTKTIKKQGQVSLQSGDIPGNTIVELIYDGTFFQLVNSRRPTFSTAGPSGGVDGDVWFQYT